MDDDMKIILQELEEKMDKIDCSALDQAADMLVEANRVYAYGCGRSGFSMQAFAMRMMHLGKESHFVHDTCVPPIKPGDALFVASGSGNTESTAAVVKEAIQNKASVILISSAEKSVIQEMADLLIYIPLDEFNSVQYQSNCYDETQFILQDIIIYKARKQLGLTREAMDQNHTNIE